MNTYDITLSLRVAALDEADAARNIAERVHADTRRAVPVPNASDYHANPEVTKITIARSTRS